MYVELSSNEHLLIFLKGVVFFTFVQVLSGIVKVALILSDLIRCAVTFRR